MSPETKALALQGIRTQLEQLRAECDENYCREHYLEAHSGGKRAAHRYISYQPEAIVCAVCKNSPAENRCIDCHSCCYCASCHKVFHGMGRKKRHKSEVVQERVREGEQLCRLCVQRVACVGCSNRDRCYTASNSYSEDGAQDMVIEYCECCYELKHKSM